MHTIGSGDPYVWDHRARARARRNGLELADVVGVFEDERALTRRDSPTAADVGRFLILGRDLLNRIVVVAYVRRGRRIVLLGARKANPRERRQYQAGDR